MPALHPKIRRPAFDECFPAIELSLDHDGVLYCGGGRNPFASIEAEVGTSSVHNMHEDGVDATWAELERRAASAGSMPPAPHFDFERHFPSLSVFIKEAGWIEMQSAECGIACCLKRGPVGGREPARICWHHNSECVIEGNRAQAERFPMHFALLCAEQWCSKQCGTD